MPNPEKLKAYLEKLGFALLALVVTGELIQQMLAHLSPTGLVVAFVGLVVMSPIAYFILQSQRPRAEHGPRRGAERTPLLPSNNQGGQ
jgi:hypothetical protein